MPSGSCAILETHATSCLPYASPSPRSFAAGQPHQQRLCRGTSFRLHCCRAFSTTLCLVASMERGKLVVVHGFEFVLKHAQGGRCGHRGHTQLSQTQPSTWALLALLLPDIGQHGREHWSREKVGEDGATRPRPRLRGMIYIFAHACVGECVRIAIESCPSMKFHALTIFVSL